MSTAPSTPPPEDPIRPHTYDGIQEYDKRLPNWWLYTLYITIVFWIGYWAYYQWLRVGPSGPEEVEQQLARVEAEKLTSNAKLDDATLWQMSRATTVVDAGRVTFSTNCVACHLASMRGKSESVAAIGPDLTDTGWVHGGTPMEIYATISNGVQAKGMPPWGPVLGQRKITEVVAYVLSKHNEGEPVKLETTGSPPAGAAH